MFSPGAEMSGLRAAPEVAALPRLLNEVSANPPCSGSLIAATVIALDAAPGDPIVHKAGPLLPAAAATTTPLATALFTASDVASVPLAQPFVPSERLITCAPFATAQSIPAVIVDIRPYP